MCIDHSSMRRMDVVSSSSSSMMKLIDNDNDNDNDNDKQYDDQEKQSIEMITLQQKLKQLQTTLQSYSSTSNSLLLSIQHSITLLTSSFSSLQHQPWFMTSSNPSFHSHLELFCSLAKKENGLSECHRLKEKVEEIIHMLQIELLYLRKQLYSPHVSTNMIEYIHQVEMNSYHHHQQHHQQHHQHQHHQHQHHQQGMEEGNKEELNERMLIEQFQLIDNCETQRFYPCFQQLLRPYLSVFLCSDYSHAKVK